MNAYYAALAQTMRSDRAGQQRLGIMPDDVGERQQARRQKRCKRHCLRCAKQFDATHRLNYMCATCAKNGD